MPRLPVFSRIEKLQIAAHGRSFRHLQGRAARGDRSAADRCRARDVDRALRQPRGDGAQRLYTDPVVAAERSAYQQIVVTERDGDVRLYLDGDLQFSSLDEHHYTETLVHPDTCVRSPTGPHPRQLGLRVGPRPAGYHPS